MKAFIILMLFPLIASAQAGNYTIEGRVSGPRVPAKAYLIYNSATGGKIDSAAILKGAFSFRGTVAEPVHASVVLDHKGAGINAIDPNAADILNIYLERGELKLNITDSVSKAVISGSALTEDYEDLQKLIRPLTARFNAMMAEYYALPPAEQGRPEVQANLREKYNVISSGQKQLLTDYIRNNPEKLVSLDAVITYGGAEPNVSEVEPLFNSLSAATRKLAAAQAYEAIINRFKYTAVGAIAPDFEQNDPEGKPVKLSSFRGKYVLIDFWASWCGPCRQENPNVVYVYQQYRDKNFTVLGVSLDRPDARNSWLKAIKDDNLTWTQVSDLKYWQNAVAVQYGIREIPRNFLLDPEGRIIAKNLRGEELRLKLAELIK